MRIVGIIAEFNPFHNGHKYIIDTAKKLTNADYAIIVMSGNYVQRGTPAICDKFTRTRMAVDNGADVVIELPVIYSCGSARYFAEGAINLLNSLGCVDFLAFGAEYLDISFLENISDILYKEPDYYKERLNHHIKNGISFPNARENALSDYLQINDENFDEKAFRDIMASPNCILGIEYMCALKKFDSKIEPVPIQRVMAGYHQLEINSDICSASALRNIMDNFDNISDVKSSIPDSVFSIMKEEYNKSFPIYENDFSSILGSSIINNKDLIDDFFDISNTFANRIKNLSDNFCSYEQFADELTAKNTTRTYSNRSLLHIMLGIQNNFAKRCFSSGYNFYIRILGFNKKNSDIFTKLKETSSLPIITKISDSIDSLSDIGKELLELNIRADELYRYTQNIKFKSYISNEYQRGIYIKR